MVTKQRKNRRTHKGTRLKTAKTYLSQKTDGKRDVNSRSRSIHTWISHYGKIKRILSKTADKKQNENEFV